MALHQPKEWWGQVSPWMRHLIRFLKFGVPLGAAIEGVYNAATAKQFEAEIALMEQMVASLPDLGDDEHPRSFADSQGRTQEAEGAALRALRNLLKALDPAEHWADLRRTPTPDGNILWLCAEHRAVYEVKPLVLPD
jgi:internalin A